MKKAIVYELYDVILFVHGGLDGSSEFALGMRELEKRLPDAHRWYVPSGGTAPKPQEFALWSKSSLVMVILNPALLASDNLQDELVNALGADRGSRSCVLPSDPRGFTSGVSLDYASRPGFDRFVPRLAKGPRWIAYDGRAPWLYMVTRQALAELGSGDVSWEQLPVLLAERTAIAGHAFVHSYADYYFNSRAEMLRLLPETVRTLLDVGGGEGNFGKIFMSERGGKATLLEPNPSMAGAARLKGLAVLEGDFQSVVLQERYDCVTFLDVLEHMADPLEALIKARQALRPRGNVLLSVPNVGHWSVVWDLLEGSFEYLPAGILCNTHLRFFTRAGLETVLHDAGFTVERWENITAPLPEAFAAFIESHPVAGITPNLDSLCTECFHVLARKA
ncbi:MAG: class I SAM-dependent methyltransferase [Desulfurivibrionaceae bacterium]|jgi:2-polyprenyl-3-methyl-5-hydroxy-6-metoxy-1,4-benzoquinol methylase